MSTRTWRGYAVAQAEVQTLTPANPQEGVVYTATINGKDVTYTVTAADMADGASDEAAAVAKAVDGLVAAWNASTIPEFAEITASDSTTAMTLTHDTSGVPFTVSGAGTNGISAQNEVQTLTITGTPTGGTFTLTYDGQTTSTIAYNADAATVDAALEALSNIGAGDVTCAGGALPGTPVTIQFTSALAQLNVALITADGSGLTGGSSPDAAVATTTPGSAGDPTLANATTTSATGPNHFDNADNWSGGAVPVDSDDIVFENSDVDCKYGLSQTSVSPASTTVKMSYTGKIGLPRKNSNGYIEYRTTYLTIGDSGDGVTNTVEIGEGTGAGSGRLKISTNDSQTILNVLNTGQGAESGIPALLWKGTHASNVANLQKGSVGIAFFDGESATLSDLNVNYVTNVTGDVQLRCGDGLTLTTVDMAGGQVTLESAATTINQYNGELTHRSGNITTLTIDGGTYFEEAANTTTTLLVGSDGVYDCRRNLKSRTITNISLHERSAFHDPFGTVTASNGYDFVRCTPGDVTFNVKPHQTWTPTSI